MRGRLWTHALRQMSAPARGEPKRRTSPRQTLAVAADGNLLPYLVGNLISTTGTWFQTLGQSVLIYQLTGSELMLGVVGFAQFAAVLVLAPFTGAVADRYDRRRLIIVSQLAAAASTAVFAAMAAMSLHTASTIIGFALFLGVTSAFVTPATMALVPTLVAPQNLLTAVALQSATFNIGRVTGPILAAVVIGTMGPSLAFALNAASYLAVVAGVLAVRPLVRQPRLTARARVRDGLSLVLGDRRLLGLLGVVAAVNLAVDPVTTLGPAFVSRLFDREAADAGLLVGAFGVGAVVAVVLVSHRLRATSQEMGTTLTITIIGALALAASPNLACAFLALVVMGFGYLATNVMATSRLQLSVDDQHRGRIMALWTVAFMGVRPVGSLLDGLAASWLGIRVASALMVLPAAIALVYLAPARGALRAQKEAR